MAVLINAAQRNGSDGSIELQPRNDDELGELKELVESAIGFDADRGDVVTLKSMPFEASNTAGTAFAPSFWSNFSFDLMSLIQIAILAIVAVTLALFVLRPLLLRPSAQADAVSAQLSSLDTKLPQSASPALEGEIDPDTQVIDQPTTIPAIPNEPADPLSQRDPVERLRALIAERQDESIDILRSWLEDRKETT